jgi:hypothetical protein
MVMARYGPRIACQEKAQLNILAFDHDNCHGGARHYLTV